MNQLSDLRLASIKRRFSKVGLKDIDIRKINTSSFQRIFREKMYSSIVFALANNNSLNKKIVIKGGGALLLAYNSQRRTDDIDFAILPQKNDKTFLLKDIKENLLNLKPKIEKVLLKPTLKSFKESSSSIRISYSIYFDESFKPAIQLEGRYEPVLLKPLKINIGLFGNLLVQQPQEILAEKIVALFTRWEKRGSIKTTDIFDIYYLATFFGLEINREILEQRIKNDFHNPPPLSQWKKYLQPLISFIENSNKDLSEALKKQLDKNYFEALNIRKIISDTKNYLLDLFSKIGI